MNDYYIKAWDTLEDLELDSDDESEEAVNLGELKINLCNNIALCAFKTSDWKKSIEFSTNALNHDGDNVKALYRRALNYI